MGLFKKAAAVSLAVSVLFWTVAETWASSLDYSSSNQVSFSQKAFYKNVGTPQWNAVNLSVQANRDALGLGAELPSEASVTYDNATGKIYADGSEICDVANPGGVSPEFPQNPSMFVVPTFVAAGGYAYAYYGNGGGGNTNYNFQRCALDGSDVWTAWFAPVPSWYAITTVSDAENHMGLYSGNGLCFVAIDGGFKLRCVGPEKFSATNSEFADNYYVYSEDPYVSEEIAVPSGMSSVYAKAVADVPSGTSYKFEISTSNGFSELIPVADFASGIAAVNSNSISLNKSSNPDAQSVYDSLSVGDSISMNATEFRVSNKYDDGTWLNLVFVTKTGGWAFLPVGTEWFPVMVSSANWTEIPSGSLNGTVAASEISDAVADKAEILSLLTAESNKDHEERAYKSAKYAAFLNAPNFASTVSGVSKVFYVDISK